MVRLIGLVGLALMFAAIDVRAQGRSVEAADFGQDLVGRWTYQAVGLSAEGDTYPVSGVLDVTVREADGRYHATLSSMMNGNSSLQSCAVRLRAQEVNIDCRVVSSSPSGWIADSFELLRENGVMRGYISDSRGLWGNARFSR